MKTVTASIHFLTDQSGGVVPAGPRYSTVARFRQKGGEWAESMWSVVADFRSPAKDNSVLADVRFLVDDAPEELLFPNNRFELWEGPHKVAEGEVVGPAPAK